MLELKVFATTPGLNLHLWFIILHMYVYVHDGGSIHMKVRGQAYGVVYSYFAWSLGLEPGLTGQPSHQLTFTLDLED